MYLERHLKTLFTTDYHERLQAIAGVFKIEIKTNSIEELECGIHQKYKQVKRVFDENNQGCHLTRTIFLEEEEDFEMLAEIVKQQTQVDFPEDEQSKRLFKAQLIATLKFFWYVGRTYTLRQILEKSSLQTKKEKLIHCTSIPEDRGKKTAEESTDNFEQDEDGKRFSLPEGDVLVGGIFDLSYSMRESIVGSARRARQTSKRANAVFRTLSLLIDVALEEVENHDREVRIFASAVGVCNLPWKTCDLLDLLDQIDELFYKRRFYIEDAVSSAAELGPKGVAGKVWIRENIEMSELDDLMRYVITHPNDAQRLVDALPSPTISKNINNVDSIPLIGKLLVKTTNFGAKVSAKALFGGSEAMKMKHEFVEIERRHREERTRGEFQPEKVTQKPTPRSVRDLSESLKFLKEDVDKMLVAISPFVFGSTPLGEAMQNAVDVCSESQEKGKVVFIVSDGNATDSPRQALQAAKRLREMGVLIVTCFLTDDEMLDSEMKKLYYSPRSEASKGERLVFEMATGGMRCVEPPVSLLVHSRWSVPDEGECKLFFRANNLAVVEEFHTLVTSALVQNPEATALGIASQIEWARYNVEMVENEQVHDQGKTGTCWAHSVGTVLHLAMHRVVGRFDGYPTFSEIKEKLIEKFSSGERSSRVILSKVVEDKKNFPYRLRYEEVKVSQARQACIRHLSVLARFDLYGKEWDKFSKFFKKTPKKVLKAKDVLIGTTPKGKRGGHAVVLVDVAPGCLTFQNSWGEKWGNKGRFRIENAEVLRNMKFYSVFWYEKDLLEEEKQAWKGHEKKLMRDLEKNFPALAKFYHSN